MSWAARVSMMTAAAVLAWASMASAVTVYTAEGEAISGELSGLVDGVVEIGARKIPLTEIDRVMMSGTSGGHAPRTPAEALAQQTARALMNASAPPTPTAPKKATPKKSAAKKSTSKTADKPAETGPPGGVRWDITTEAAGRLSGRVTSWSDGRIGAWLTVGGQAMKMDVDAADVREAWNRELAQKSAPDRDGEPTDADVVYALPREGAGEAEAAQRVTGKVVGIDGDSLVFNFEGEERKLKLSRVVAVITPARGEAKPDRAFHQTLHTADGTVIPGQWRSLERGKDGRLGFETRWGKTLTVPVTAVEEVRCRNGRVTHLGDLSPVKVEQTPYFDRVMGYRVDTTLAGKPLKLTDDSTPARGIAVHARTVLTYDLGGEYERLLATAGFESPDGRRGDVDLRIVADGKVVMEKTHFTGSDPVLPIDVSLAGVRKLTLLVDFGGGGDLGDRVVWAAPRLIRKGGP